MANMYIKNNHTSFLQICILGIMTIHIFRFPLNFCQNFPEIKAKFVSEKRKPSFSCNFGMVLKPKLCSECNSLLKE